MTVQLFKSQAVSYRLRGILVIFFILGVGISFTYFLRSHWINEGALAMRETGMAKYELSEYANAMSDLGGYLQRYPNDADALLNYARSRAKVKAAKSRNITDAMGVYRRVIELEPSHLEARRELLRLYLYAQYHSETVRLAEEILLRDPEDLEALMARGTALMGLRDYAKAIEAAQSAAKKHPLAIESHILVLHAMAQLKRIDDEIIAYGNAVGQAMGDDLGGYLVKGVAFGLIDDLDQAKVWLMKAATSPRAETAFCKELVRQLDRIGEFEAANRTLSAVAKLNKDVEYRRLYAARLWQTGLSKNLAELLANVVPSDPASDSQLLVFKALLLNKPATLPDARAIVEVLAKRPLTDDVAAAWAPLFREVFMVAEPDPVTVIRLTDEALLYLPGEPHILFVRGSAHLSLNEPLRALYYWQQAADNAPAWSLPRLRMARVYAAMGRGDEAIRAANEAMRRASGNLEASITMAQAVYALEARSVNSDAFLHFVEQIQQHVNGEEETLPIYIALLARNGMQDKAKQRLTEILGSKTPASQPTLLRLATISDEMKLGLAPVLLDRTEQLYGIAAPVTHYRAQRERRTGGNEAALALFQKAWDSVPNGKNDNAWRMTWAMLLSDMNDPHAGEAWIKLADDMPGDRNIQRMASEARATQHDREFLDRAIQRMKKLAVYESTDWRMARVRWLLARDKNTETAAEAALLLREVIQITYDDITARRMLAHCFQRMGNIPAAIDELQTANRIQPTRADVALDLAAVLQSVGDFAKGRELIDRALVQQSLSRRDRQMAAELLAAQGATDLAITTLESGLGDAGTTDRPNLLLARLYWTRKQPDKARATFESLLASPTGKADPMVIQLAATFFEDAGDGVRAGQVLTMLNQVKLPAGIRELMIAEHHGRAGNREVANQKYAAATKAAPTNDHIWRQFAAYLVRDGRLEEAVKIIDASLVQLPKAESLAFVRANVGLIRRAAEMDMKRLGPMILAMIADTENQAAAARAIQEIVTAAEKKTDTPTLMTQLRRCADQSPRFLDLQILVASTYTLVGHPEEAIKVAARAMATFPTASAPAAISATAFAVAKQWDEVIPAADAWLALSPGDIAQVTILKGEALVNLGRPEDAARLLEPYFIRSAADQKVPSQLLAGYVRALLASKRTDEAVTASVALLARDASWATPLVELINDSKAADADAAKLLTEVEKQIKPDDAEQRLSVAEAWLRRSREGTNTDIDSALAIITDLVMRKKTSVRLYYLEAMIYASQGKTSLAEASYRAMLRLDPANVIAKNNLADLLIRRPETVDEAVKLAKEAVTALPAQPNLRDTLAAAELAAGRPAEAIRHLLEAVRVEPDKTQWHVNLVWAYLENGQKREAQKALDDVRTAIEVQTLAPATKTRVDRILERLGSSAP